MKLQGPEVPQSSSARLPSRIFLLTILPLLLITIPLYFLSLRDNYFTKKLALFSIIASGYQYRSPVPTAMPPTASDSDRGAGIGRAGSRLEAKYAKSLIGDEKCDLFTGEWVQNPDGPAYTNETCGVIQDHQNCLRFGRPDSGYLNWRWKPDGCELPAFDPRRFLRLVRGKSMVLVGDSIARNHLQSLICLLSTVAKAKDLSSDVYDQNRRYEFSDHNFTISLFWSPYLVRTGEINNIQTRPYDIYLDEPDLHWTTVIPRSDYLLISAGHWFFRPTYFHVAGHLSGCLYCPEPGIHRKTAVFGYRRALRTALRAVTDAQGFNGVAFLRTFAPSHFEGGKWDSGGDCLRTRPFRRDETAMEEYAAEMYSVQLEEVRIAQERSNGGAVRVFDVTAAMQMRPDGHPGRYGQPAEEKRWVKWKDCVHWCLPGPIDAWNDMLQELVGREAA